MSFINRQSIAVTTDGAGAATAYSAPVMGFFHGWSYTPHATTPLDTNADITITEEDTGKAIVTISNIGLAVVAGYPRVGTSDTSNLAALYAAAGQPVNDLISVFGRVKLVVANGVAAKSGTFYVYIV